MRQFSQAHLAALAVLVIACVASVWLPRRYPGRWVIVYSRALALLILAGWVGEYVADVINGSWSLKYTLPLQLTDAVSLAAIIALWARRQLAVELVYFWSLTASLQATLTPDLAQTCPSVYYFTYFTYHVGAVTAAMLLVFGCGIYPRPRAAWRVFVLTLGWAVVAGLGCVFTGGNYMYLRAKPVHNSLLNVMGPWPWYIIATIGLGLLMLLALQLIADFVQASQPARAGPPAGTPVHP